jgi:hypothetical protein
MATLKQQNRMLWIAFITLSILITLCGMVVMYFTYSPTSRKPSKVCMTVNEFKELQHNSIPNTKHSTIASVASSTSPTIDDSRDRRVLNDPLYPALNRSEFNTHQGIADKIKAKALYNNTQEFTDRYRLVGYVTSQDNDKKDSGGNVWKLMARQKDRNRADFYMIPANNNYDMKVMLNDDIIMGDKLRDVYTIPKQLTFKTPLLNDSAYEVTELPMNDFTNSYN